MIQIVLPEQQPFDHELSQWAHDETWPVPKHCYWNAWRAWKLPELRRALYVEGYGVHLFPFVHGWLELDGLIVDPTLPDQDSSLGHMLYFPGIRYTRQDAKTLAKRQRLNAVKLPLWEYYSPLENFDPRMRLAYVYGEYAVGGAAMLAMLAESNHYWREWLETLDDSLQPAYNTI